LQPKSQIAAERIIGGRILIYHKIMPMSIVFALGFLLSLVTILGDFILKNASLRPGFGGWPSLVIGCLLYGLTGLGWFFLMRRAELSTLGVLYSVATIIGLTLLGAFLFKERINPMEIVGIILAIVSVVIMYKFA